MDTTRSPIIHWPRAKSSSVSSGASSGSTQASGEFFPFALIGIPHGNNAAFITAWCPDQDHNPLTKQANGRVALLAIIPPDVRDGDRDAGEHLGSIGKIESALTQGDVAFVLVEFNIHTINVVTFISFIKKKNIRYALDLTKILTRPTRTSLTLLQRLTGIEMDDLVEDRHA